MKANPLLKLIGTTLYTGYIPLGPGTFASILAIPLVILLAKSSLTYIITTIVILLIGIWSAEHLTRVWNKKDDQRITIDEFVGILVTFFLIPRINGYILVIGFILFRFFDIVKPLFIRKTERVSGGLGVMLDDVVSGIYANLLLRVFLLIIK
jgi:phosphatidylglycerophosphatase A